MNWQVIQTAPRNGTTFLSSDGMIYGLTAWDGRTSEGDWFTMGTFTPEGTPFDAHLKNFRPTHWTPLQLPEKTK